MSGKVMKKDFEKWFDAFVRGIFLRRHAFVMGLSFVFSCATTIWYLYSTFANHYKPITVTAAYNLSPLSKDVQAEFIREYVSDAINKTRLLETLRQSEYLAHLSGTQLGALTNSLTPTFLSKNGLILRFSIPKREDTNRIAQAFIESFNIMTKMSPGVKDSFEQLTNRDLELQQQIGVRVHELFQLALKHDRDFTQTFSMELAGGMGGVRSGLAAIDSMTLLAGAIPDSDPKKKQMLIELRSLKDEIVNIRRRIAIFDSDRQQIFPELTYLSAADVKPLEPMAIMGALVMKAILGFSFGLILGLGSLVVLSVVLSVLRTQKVNTESVA